ncbi:hypothetical protein Trydic_g16847 [Trypoxylus dichotomus]
MSLVVVKPSQILIHNSQRYSAQGEGFNYMTGEGLRDYIDKYVFTENEVEHPVKSSSEENDDEDDSQQYSSKMFGGKLQQAFMSIAAGCSFEENRGEQLATTRLCGQETFTLTTSLEDLSPKKLRIPSQS